MVLTKQQRNRNDGTKEPTNEKSTKDRTNPHASTENRTKDTRSTRRYHVRSGRVVHSLSRGPWYQSFANGPTYVRTQLLTETMARIVYRWQCGLDYIARKQMTLIRTVLEKDLAMKNYAHTHGCHDDMKSITIPRQRLTETPVTMEKR